jgi:two-component system chemotaxis sensor kinase CheA
VTIDISQFLEVFYEESFEGLDIMESGLLDMSPGPVEGDLINSVFRAAHSIKGGGGTFGLSEVSEFTHVVETLLDEMRSGQREMTAEANEALLVSVDCLREMLNAKREDTEIDQERIDAVSGQLDRLLSNGETPATQGSIQAASQVSEETGSSTAEGGAGWRISFAPHKTMSENGNDALLILRQLAQLGECEVVMDSAQLPRLQNMDPRQCHLAWNIVLHGQIERSEIDELFEWVVDDCDLSIEALQSEKSAASDSPVASDTTVTSDTPKFVIINDPPAAEKTETKGVAARSKPKTKESGSIRVSIDKIDALINTIGELVITQSMLTQIGEDFQLDRLEQLNDGLAQLSRNTRELQEGVLGIRMLPISFSFNRFPRMVHDTALKLAKKVTLEMKGQETEVDKTVMEKIGDPLVHLVRNSVDHGIENPDVRLAAGKSETGLVTLEASHRSGNIIIEITDDGAGINRDKLLAKAISTGVVSKGDLDEEEILSLIFHPGLTTADAITDVSGRGVGMDVVRSNIRDLGGSIDVSSELGVGSKFTIRLPLTLAILEGQTISVGDETYIIPLVSIVESIQVHPDMLNLVAGRGETFKLRSEYLPIIRLHKIFGVESECNEDLTSGILVVVESEGGRYGLFVDDLSVQQQVVIKSMEANYRKVEGISGATILGDGSVALILDLPGLIRLGNQNLQTAPMRISA